jgi:hypothetical protein
MAEKKELEEWREEKRERQKRRLLLRLSFIALLSVSIGSATASAFAYASASSLLNLSEVQVSTISEATIDLGIINATTGNKDYYSQLSEDNLKASGQASLLERTFAPVSSAFKSKWLVKDSNDTYDSVTPKFSRSYENKEIGFPGYDVSATHFLQLEMWIKEENTNSLPVDMYLDSSTVVKADETKNSTLGLQKAAADGKTLNAADLNNVINALRISILTPTNYYILDPYKSQETVLAGRLDTDGDGYYDSFGVGFENGTYTDKEALYGEMETTDYSALSYDAASSVDSVLVGTASGFNAKTQAGIKPLNIEKSLENGVKLKAEDSTLLSAFTYKSADDMGTKLISLQPGEEKRVVISYYFEGWDLDCTDDIKYASFLSSLTLRGRYDYSYRQEI